MPITIDSSSHYRTETSNKQINDPAEEEHMSAENALSQIFKLLSKLESIFQTNRRDFIEHVRADLKGFSEQSKSLSQERKQQGWSVASLTLVGAVATVLAVSTQELSQIDPRLEDLVDLFGGAESVEKLLTSSSQTVEGIKPVVNAWSDSKSSLTESNKQLEQFFFQQGQRAAEQSGSQIDKIMNALNRLLDLESSTRRNY